MSSVSTLSFELADEVNPPIRNKCSEREYKNRYVCSALSFDVNDCVELPPVMYVRRFVRPYVFKLWFSKLLHCAVYKMLTKTVEKRAAAIFGDDHNEGGCISN